MSASRILELETILAEASAAYYNDEAIMEDFEFDALEAELRQLDPTNAHFKGVGSAPASATGKIHWKKATHSQPMGSLNKVQTPEEFSDWARKIGDHEFIVMPKFDGLSISLEYRDGLFVQAITRGDGVVGDDVTANVMRIPFPKTFARFTGFIRGEVMIRKSSFAKNFPGEKNPRNSAVGTLKRLDGAKCEFLTIFAYGITLDSRSSKSDEIMILRGAGFETYPIKTGDVGDVLADYQDHVAGVRAALDYEIDGLVIAINDTDERESLGSHDMRPKGAIAFKFPHEEGFAVIQDIICQVGNSGRIAPVAVFSPTKLAGADVKRASLHNMSYIERLGGIAIGAKIRVSRRNDVIPAVEEVVQQGTGKMFTPPTHCPECSFPLVYEGLYLVCKGENCTSQKIGVIRSWIQKLGILNFGEGIIEATVATGRVKSIIDLYTLTADEVATTSYSDGRMIGRAIATKAIENLHAKKVHPLWVIVGSLSIPLIGRGMVKVFFEAGFDSLEKMGSATVAELAAVPGVGLGRAEAFYNGIRANSSLICQLFSVGVVPEEPKAQIVGPMSGKTMVMTGFRDKALAAAFEAAGGSVKDGVNKTTTYLVAKDISGGSSKLQKARDMGVTVLDLAMMNHILASL